MIVGVSHGISTDGMRALHEAYADSYHTPASLGKQLPSHAPSLILPQLGGSTGGPVTQTAVDVTAVVIRVARLHVA